MKIDPTRTVTLRRQLRVEITRRFRRLKGRIVHLVLVEDAFGIKEAVHDFYKLHGTLNEFCPTGVGGGVDATCSPSRGGWRARWEARKADRAPEPKPTRAERGFRERALDEAAREHERHHEHEKVREGTGGKIADPAGVVELGAHFAEHHLEAVGQMMHAHAMSGVGEAGGTVAAVLATVKLIGGPLGAKVADMEHMAASWVHDKIAAGIARLPAPLGKAAAAIWTATRMALGPLPPARIASAMAERVAKERGLRPHEARMLRGHLATMDVALDPPATLAGGPLMKLVPVATSSYLLYSTARDPVATAKAAHSLMKDVTGSVKDWFSPTKETHNALTQNDAELVADAFARHGFDDWYFALLSAATDQLPTVHAAVEAADHAYLAHPKPIVVNTRFAFESDSAKVDAFERWLKTQVESDVLDEDVWKRFTMMGYEKGAGRAFDDTNKVRKKRRWKTGEGDFYAGSKEQFLRDAFAHPVSVDKVKLLAKRTYRDLKNVTDHMATKMRRVLADGLTRGDSPRDVAGDLADEVDIGDARAQTVARTEIIRAHAEGQLDAMEQLGVSEVGVAVEWLTTADAYCSQLSAKEKRLIPCVCEECEPMEGVVLDIKKAHGMIPRHPNAVFAGSTFISYGECQEIVRAKYSGPAVILVCAGNHRTTIGPNHPMLTQRGMVKAAEIKKGDKVLYDLRHDHLLADILNVNNKKIPTCENVFETCLAFCKDSLVSTSGSDLHGDRMFCQGEVQAIAPAWSLLGKFNVGILQELSKQLLVGADADAASVSSFAPGTSCGDGIFLTSSGCVSGPTPKVSADFVWLDVHSASLESFEGWAFDYTTASSLYCNNGFVVKNCRCAWIPANVGETDTDDQIDTKGGIMSAIRESVGGDGGFEGTPWAGADADIARKRPEPLENAYPVTNDLLQFSIELNRFCPTGPGGGVDPSCGAGDTPVPAHDALETLRGKGGFTYKVGQKKFQNIGEDGYSVSPYPERSKVFDGKVAEHDVVDYTNANDDLLAKDDHAVGAWHDPSSGKTFLDIAIVTGDRNAAIRIGREHHQIAIFGFKNAETIPTGGRGGVKANRHVAGPDGVAQGNQGSVEESVFGVNDSYFSDCERDEHGWCMAREGSGEPEVPKDVLFDKRTAEAIKSDFTDAESAALATYTDHTINVYREVNKTMRSCPPDFKCLSDEQREFVDNVESAIAKFPKLDKPVEVYRGLNKVPEDFLDKFQAAVGREITMPSLTSTTLAEGRAEKFGAGAKFRIQATHVAYLTHGVSLFPEERECLLSCRARFRVTAVRGNEVHLEQIS